MFDQNASREKLEQVAISMKERNFEAVVVKDKKAALKFLQDLFPKQAQVMTASSTTLNEIGFTDFLNAPDAPVTSVHGLINQENDESKRHQLRKQAIMAEYFLASPNAVTEDGIIVAVDATGSRVGAMPYAAEHLVLVVGAQKIVQNLDEAMRRIREYVFPKEDQRALQAYGAHSSFGKWVILEREVVPGRITVVLVEEALGF
jgi:L-lactate utilization protein LutC